MLPYTLYNRENMVAWIAAGNTKENYGKLVCYKYPKTTVIVSTSVPFKMI